MSRRKEILDDLVDKYENVEGTVVVWELHQVRPCTSVLVTVPEYKARAVGFSKCMWPDEWNPDYGVDLAVKKALAKIAREITGKGETCRSGA